MPIILTTAFNPGDNDPGKTYGRFKITNIDINVAAGELVISGDYGTVEDGVFVRGAASKHETLVVNDREGDQFFTNVLATPVIEGETVYDVVRRAAYVALQTKVARLAGTLDE